VVAAHFTADNIPPWLEMSLKVDVENVLQVDIVEEE
jgi:hypothetical protein